MKNHLILFTLLISVFVFSPSLFAQKTKVPIENENNALQLNVVYQNYLETTQNQYGHTTSSKEKKFLLLKVNNQYLGNDETGVNKNRFDKYLKNCPKALDISHKGFNLYKKSNNSRRIGKWSTILSIPAALLYAGRGSDVGGINKNYIALGIVGGGLVSRWIHFAKSNRQYERADERIIEAIKFYDASCYVPLKSNDDGSSPNGIDQTPIGTSNEDEEIFIDYEKGDMSNLFVSVGPFGKFTYLDNIALGFGVNGSLYKSGFFANVELSKLFSFGTEDVVDKLPEYFASATVGFPLRSKEKKVKTRIGLGTAYGIDASGNLDDVASLKSFGIQGGISRYQMYNFESFNYYDYQVSSTLIKGGIYLNWISKFTYKVVNDNRFSDKEKYSFSYLRLYFDAVYNLQNSYDLLEPPSQIVIEENPSHKDLGFQLGLEAKVSSSKWRTVNVGIELGFLPINNDARGVSGQLKLGMDLYKF